MSVCRRVGLERCLTPHTNVNSGWITDLNIGPKTVELLEESIGRKPLDIGLGRSEYDSQEHRQQKQK